MFKLKDKVVYPGHGIAIIEEMIEKQVSGTVIQFFKLNFLFKDMTILVPINNLEGCGVRRPSDKKIVEQAMNELYKIPQKKLDCLDFTPSGWNRRNKEYQIKIQNGKLIELMQIYRDLMYLSQQKELSFGEKNLLQTAEDLLIQEIQLVTDKGRDFIIQELQEPLKQFFFFQTLQTEQITA